MVSEISLLTNGIKKWGFLHLYPGKLKHNLDTSIILLTRK